MKQFSLLVARTLISNLGSLAKATMFTCKEASGPFWPGGPAEASCRHQVLIPVEVKIPREAHYGDLGQSWHMGTLLRAKPKRKGQELCAEGKAFLATDNPWESKNSHVLVVCFLFVKENLNKWRHCLSL